MEPSIHSDLRYTARTSVGCPSDHLTDQTERSCALGSGQEAIALLVEITGQLQPREFFLPCIAVERDLGHPMRRGLSGARTGMHMLHKTRVFWVLTEEELPTFRRSVVSPASDPNTQHLWRLICSSAPL